MKIGMKLNIDIEKLNLNVMINNYQCVERLIFLCGGEYLLLLGMVSPMWDK